jgi:hypothetical protein
MMRNTKRDHEDALSSSIEKTKHDYTCRFLSAPKYLHDRLNDICSNAHLQIIAQTINVVDETQIVKYIIATRDIRNLFVKDKNLGKTIVLEICTMIKLY